MRFQHATDVGTYSLLSSKGKAGNVRGTTVSDENPSFLLQEIGDELLLEDDCSFILNIELLSLQDGFDLLLETVDECGLELTTHNLMIHADDNAAVLESGDSISMEAE